MTNSKFQIATGEWQSGTPFLASYFRRLSQIETMRSVGTVTRAVGLVIESKGPAVSVGDICYLEGKNGELNTPLEAIGFRDSTVLLMPLGQMPSVRAGDMVFASGHRSEVAVGSDLLGRVVDALGRPLDGLGEIEPDCTYPLYRETTNPLARANITEPLGTGVRAIDGLLTIGAGQRIGIFGGSGVGKSTLLGMMAKNTTAELNVIALIGERGREVREFIENELGPEGMERSVVIVSTSDDSPLVRIRAALAATAIAEYFKDCGARVFCSSWIPSHGLPWRSAKSGWQPESLLHHAVIRLLFLLCFRDCWNAPEILLRAVLSQAFTRFS